MKIPLGVVGSIQSGNKAGWQVKIEDDTENTGGFLILTSPNFSARLGEGFDDWVENESDLQQYFEEACWTIDWTEQT